MTEPQMLQAKLCDQLSFLLVVAGATGGIRRGGGISPRPRAGEPRLLPTSSSWVGEGWGVTDGWWRPWKLQEAQRSPDGALKSPRDTGQSTHKSPKPGLKSLPSPLL